MRRKAIKHALVDAIPDALEEGTLYISVPFATAVHKCCCGCGYQAVTPLMPTDWSLTFDGETVTLDPSIGNSAFPCRSHYWVYRGRIEWVAPWSRAQIEAGRAGEVRAKNRYYRHKTHLDVAQHLNAGRDQEGASRGTLWDAVRRWLKSF
jgi:hypothetical protein